MGPLPDLSGKKAHVVFAQIGPTKFGMTTVRDEVDYVLSGLRDEREKLLAQVHNVDRSIALIKFLDSDNHKLRKHIQATNRRQRDEYEGHPGGDGVRVHRPLKRLCSPKFSDEEDGQL